MNSDNNRNLIIFFAIVLLALAYEQFFIAPKETTAQQQRAAAAAAAQANAAKGLTATGQPVVAPLTQAQALGATPRVSVQTPALSGSISLTGARYDDLSLRNYHETTQTNSPPVQLWTPLGAENSYYAEAGWVGTNVAGLPNGQTPWTQTSQGPLTPANPLELTYAASSGLTFHREIKVDPQFMFTQTDTVTNTGAAPVTIAPYGAVERHGVPPTLGKIAMEGAIGMFDKVLKEAKYPKWKKDGAYAYTSTGGWLGITDKYFMTVFAPPQSEPIQAKEQVSNVGGVDVYETSYVGQARAVAPGASVTEVTHVFAGAKVVKTLQAYGAQLGLPNFDKAVDWGFLELLSKPVFLLLDTYAGWLSHLGLGFGFAILALTITIRLVMFPAFNASYGMSTKMKKVQPQMKALQERYKNDPTTLQKEMMGLYAKEKINPVTGCIPMLLPLPVFYALNNVFNVTIEMRQASFGWVKDLSSPDPTTIWNLFGLLPWNPDTVGWLVTVEHLPFVGGVVLLILHLGAWPIIYACTMWVSLLTGPTMTGIDPTQQRLMRWMPWIFMIVLAQSAVGLVIYWAFSSVFTMVQQYVLMRRFKVDNPIDQFFARLTAPKAS
jgi:YidC/Oxa1 family membrane protein insertase